MKTGKLLVWVPLALFVVGLGVFSVDLFSPAERDVRSAMVGKTVPQFELRASITERPGLSDADLRDGNAKMLNIFASWCVPCAVEAPQLERLKEQGAEIVAVAIRDRPEDVEEFLARYGNPFTKIGADDRSAMQLELGSSGVPETFIIDGKGVIRHQHIGEIREEHVPILLAKLAEAQQ